MPIADHNGQPVDGETGLDPGYVFSPYIPRERAPVPIDPNDFSIRKGIRSRHSALFPIEPSAVDRLAALEDQEGEAGQRVKAWEKAEEDRRKRRGNWKVYKDPLTELHDRPRPLTIKPVEPKFFGTCTLADL